MSYAPMACTPSGAPAFKRGSGAAIYKSDSLTDPPDLPAPGTGAYWTWSSPARALFVSNVISDFENVGYEDGQYTRKYWAIDVLNESNINRREIGQWKDSENPHPQPYFGIRGLNFYGLPSANSEGTLRARVTGIQPGSYPTELFVVCDISVPSPGVESITVPVSGFFGNGPHPVVAFGWIQFVRNRYG
jgi:hypothetical protein